MWTLGLGNALLLGKNADSCTIFKEKYKNVTCVWSTEAWFLNSVGFNTEIWARRLLIMARMVWLGFNVWNLNTGESEDGGSTIVVQPCPCSTCHLIFCMLFSRFFILCRHLPLS